MLFFPAKKLIYDALKSRFEALIHSCTLENVGAIEYGLILGSWSVILRSVPDALKLISRNIYGNLLQNFRLWM